MPHVKQITVAGFRGILPPLSISLVKKGGKPTSLVLYGRNGHGKSSLTDAWEWFHTGSIARLRREGAGERAYPHKAAAVAGQPSYVEIEFADSSLGTAKLAFDTKRVTKSQSSGGRDQFRSQVPHPCHIRYEDLSRFVYATKAEQYDELATLMGFTPQVEFQQSLQWVLRKLKDEVKNRAAAEDRSREAVRSLVEPVEVDAPAVLACFNGWISAHKLEPASDMQEVGARVEVLRAEIETDPKARRLAHLEGLRAAVKACAVPDGLKESVDRYVGAADAFKNGERDTTALLLLALYKQGQEVLERRVVEGGSPTLCPLCGEDFGADLLAHLGSELDALNELKVARDMLDTERKQLASRLPTVGLASPLMAALHDPAIGAEVAFAELVDSAVGVDAAAAALQSAVRVGPEKLTHAILESLRSAQTRLGGAVAAYEARRRGVVAAIEAREAALGTDAARVQLVADYTRLMDARAAWQRYAADRDAAGRLQTMYAKFDAVVQDYVGACIQDVQGRFDDVTGDVDRYFGILEEQTHGLAKPALRLVPDQDRAVTLEIEFRGEVISPAYKYLSESQLNSFGLALFLASVRRFNGGFKFLLLDDVINSFDAYKRPQLIRLLKSEFDDFQVIVLTHDDIWFEKLCDYFKGWVRKRIMRYEAGTGPVMGDGLSELEKVEVDIANGEANAAGRAMGPLLERELQELCARFEVLVTYNRRNEYTLAPLLDRFRVRVSDKLGAKHELHTAVRSLQEDMAFRNLCAHWKDPASSLTPEEMKIVVGKWNAIVALVRCSAQACQEYAVYEKDSGGFVCGCRSLTLSL